MDGAAELLGLSQRILQKQYKEIFRKTSHSKPDETISSASDALVSNEETSPSHGNVLGYDTDPNYFTNDLASLNQELDYDDYDQEVDSGKEEFKYEEGDIKQTYYKTRSGRRTKQMMNRDISDGSYSSHVMDVENTSDGEEKKKNEKKRRKRMKTGPSSERLLAQENDPEVLELQKEFIAKETYQKAIASQKKNTEKIERGPNSKKRKMSDEQGADNDPYLEKGVYKRWRKVEVDDDDYEPEGGLSGSESEKEDESDSGKNLKSESDRQVLSDLRDLVIGCDPKSFTVKRAIGHDFNLAPVENNKKRWQWAKRNVKINSKLFTQRPYFAAIIGVKVCQEEDIDPRILKYNGELLKGRPLAWSLPENEDELNKQYDAVTNAYRKVLGFSEEELYCNKLYAHAGFKQDFEPAKDHVLRKQLIRPRILIEEKLSRSFRNKSKDALCTELKKRHEEPKADQRKTDIPALTLKYDRCRVQLNKQLEEESFEGLMVIAWHIDGPVVGKILNFDDNSDLFISILRDVWVGVSNLSTYKLPFSKHILSSYMSVCERAMAPKLLQQLIDGTAPSRICPTCGEVFTILVELDKERYNKHVDKHVDNKVLGTCACEGVKEIKTQVGLQRHNKLYHGDGKYVKCNMPKYENVPIICPEVLLKSELDSHIRLMHTGSTICEECGQTFTDQKKYKVHFYQHHSLVPCQICRVEVIGFIKMRRHISQNHRGDPIPCPICGVKFADEKNVGRHQRTVHRAKEDMRYGCPYPECDKAFNSTKAFLNHLNNVHFNVYVYLCEYNCPGAKYKDESNLRSHYKKKHDHKIQGMKFPTLEDLLKTMTEEQRVYHESILRASGHYNDLVERVGCGPGKFNRWK